MVASQTHGGWSTGTRGKYYSIGPVSEMAAAQRAGVCGRRVRGAGCTLVPSPKEVKLEGKSIEGIEPLSDEVI